MSTCNSSDIISIPGVSIGPPGVSAYVYVAFAETVVSNTPDIVTGFTNTYPIPTSEWFAVLTTNTAIVTPVAADFDDLWVHFKGEPGPPGINLENYGSPITGSPFTTLNFTASGLSGVTVTNSGGGVGTIDIVTAAFIKVTRAQALTIVGLSGLIVGASYWVYDVGDGMDLVAPGQEYAGIILRAVTTSTFSSSGLYIERNIERSTAVPTRYALLTPSAFTPYDVVEYKNAVYQLLGSYNFTPGIDPWVDLSTYNPAVDVANWARITRDNNSYYYTSIGNCEYDIINDFIITRTDLNGNTFTCSNGNISMLQGFRWGSPDFKNNIITLINDGDIDLSFADFCSYNVFLNTVVSMYPIDYTTVVFFENIITSSNFQISCLYPINLYYITDTFTSCSITTYCLSSESYTTSSFSNITFTYSNQDLAILNSIFIGGTLSTAGTINNSYFFGSTLTDNAPTTTINNCSITNGIISNNTANSTITKCTGPVYIDLNYSCQIRNCSFVNDPNSPSVFNINNNESCLIDLIHIVNAGTVNNNYGIHINDCSLLNGYISYNTNNNYPSLANTSAIISEMVIMGEASISNNNFYTAAGIVLGHMHGQYCNVQNISFDSTLYTIPSIGALQGSISNFVLNCVGIDGIFSGNSILYVTGAPVNPITNNQYEYLEASNTSSNFYGFLDMGEPSVFTGGVLTIPSYLQHCGEIWLYNCTSQIIDEIVAPVYTYAKLKFPITFRVLDTDVTFQGTSGATTPQIATDSTGLTGYLIEGKSSITFKLIDGIYTQTNVNIIA